MQILFYKMTVDSGAAPCVSNGLLSLAICKPMIRTSANEGDLVFGFAARTLNKDNGLIYIARITEVVLDGRYYEESRYSTRADCIYERRNGVFRRRDRALFHFNSSHLSHDLGDAPGYPRASVLLSTDFRYFGWAAEADYKTSYPHLRRAIESLKRGHRRYHSASLRDELLALKDEAWARSRNRQLGKPTSAPDRRVSQRGGGCASLECKTELDQSRIQRKRLEDA